MKLTLSSICEYGKCTIGSRNLTLGEQLLNSNYLLLCGRINTHLTDTTNYDILAYCKQYSYPDGKPHKICGKIFGNGSIQSFQCSCKAGLGEKCKHIIATLLFCNRYEKKIIII